MSNKLVYNGCDGQMSNHIAHIVYICYLSALQIKFKLEHNIYVFMGVLWVFEFMFDAICSTIFTMSLYQSELW